MASQGNRRKKAGSADRRSLSALASDYQYGYSLEQAFYKDPSVYEAEIENIFLKSWILAGHVSQVPKSGDYFLFEFDKESVIIVRTKEGEIKAHLNVCRHRGSQLCLEKQGKIQRFTCPYHAWTYDLNGKLIAARMMSEDFDASAHGLHKAHVELVGGLIFISLADEPLSLEEMHKNLAPVFDLFGFDRMKLACQKSYPIAANWKLTVENYQECYHCAPSHKEFSEIHAMGLPPEKFQKLRTEYFSRAEKAFKIPELDCYFDLAKPGSEGYQYGRNPLYRGAKSGGANGAPVAPLLGDIQEYDGAASEFMVGPVSFFLIYNDHMVAYRFTPTSLTDSVCDVFWFVRDDAEEGADYDLEKLTWLWDVTLQADEEIIVNNQRGVDSHFYTPGRLSEMEYFEQNFLNWYIKTIGKNESCSPRNNGMK